MAMSEESILSRKTRCPKLCSDFTKLAPLGESSGTVKLEILSAVGVALLVEMVEDRCVDGDEFLQTSDPPEA
jgi:hypothetical protein